MSRWGKAAMLAALAVRAMAQDEQPRFLRGDNDIAIGMSGKAANLHTHTNVGYRAGALRAGYSGINELSSDGMHGREEISIGHSKTKGLEGVVAARIEKTPGRFDVLDRAYGVKVAMPRYLDGNVQLLKHTGDYRGLELYADLGREMRGWGFQAWPSIKRDPDVAAEVRTPTLYKGGRVELKGFGHIEVRERRVVYGIKGEF